MISLPSRRPRICTGRWSSQSGSGAVCFGIVHPEVMALGVGVGSVRATHPLHFVQQSRVCQNRLAQIGPIPPPTARDQVVNSDKGEALMVEMAMKHGGQHAVMDNYINCGYRRGTTPSAAWRPQMVLLMVVAYGMA